jgi:anaphase-promoting complex subunit 6
MKMSASVIAMEDTESSPINNKTSDIKTNIDCYRNLVHKLINLRRYKSASFWAEKIIVLSDNNPKDIYNLAQCMFLLKEYNRASHIIRRHQLEKKNLLCLLLLVECLYSAKDYQEALNLITSNEFEELGTSLVNEIETDSSELYDADKHVSRISTIKNFRFLKF